MIPYDSFFSEMAKIAEDEKKSPSMSLAKIVGSGALGFGAGTAAGLLAGYGADKLVQKTTGRKIPPSLLYGAGPLLGMASGIAYSVHKAKEQEAIRRALSNSADAGSR